MESIDLEEIKAIETNARELSELLSTYGTGYNAWAGDKACEILHRAQRMLIRHDTISPS